MARVYIFAYIDRFHKYFSKYYRKKFTWVKLLLFSVEPRYFHVDVQQFLLCACGKRKFFLFAAKLLEWKSTPVLYVNTYSKGNKQWNKTREEYIFTLLKRWWGVNLSNFFLTDLFGDTHYLICKKSISFAYIFAIICRFTQITRAGLSYKAENWHALSREQCLSTKRFLNTCPWISKQHLSNIWNLIYEKVKQHWG